jgi:CrcB protein
VRLALSSFVDQRAGGHDRAMLVFWLAVAGALGALARWGLHLALAPAALPLGALAANLLGCALFGVVMQLAAGAVVGPRMQVVLASGFVGAFTTFSTYVADVVTLAQAGRMGIAVGLALAHNAGGVLGFLGGLWAARAAIVCVAR